MSFWSKLELLVKGILNMETAAMRTNTVCQVVSYDGTTNLAVLQPCIMSIRTDDPTSPTKQLPQVADIPVYQFGSGLVMCTAAPAVGSYGLYIVSDRKIDNWLSLGGVVPPGSLERFDISNGFFLSGLFPTVVDGNNGKIVVPINTDRVELRTRLGTSYMAVTSLGALEMSALGLGLVTVDVDGTITAENTLGSLTLDGVTGQLDVNGNLTVDV